MHGGTSPGAPKGNQNARKHGLFSAKLGKDYRNAYCTLRGRGIDPTAVPELLEATATYARLRRIVRELRKKTRPTPIEALRTAHPGMSDADLCEMLLEQRGEG